MIPMTNHALAMIEAKGFDMDLVEAVWSAPAVQYPSGRYPGQHKRVGQGLCLACENGTGKVVTVFVDQEITELRPDQRRDRDALKWAKRNGIL